MNKTSLEIKTLAGSRFFHWKLNLSILLGDQEVTASLYCNFAYLYWEGWVICSIYLRVTRYLTELRTRIRLICQKRTWFFGGQSPSTCVIIDFFPQFLLT